MLDTDVHSAVTAVSTDDVAYCHRCDITVDSSVTA